MLVVKESGEKEEFSDEKVIDSIKRAGIPKGLQAEVLAHIHNKLHDEITTSQLYHHIIEFLDKSPTPLQKVKYGLKKAIMELGPTGYPFEKFVARIFEKMGYVTLTNVMLQGLCISHEIDVVLQKGEAKAMVEAKFHNELGIKTDVHVALYTKARFDDIKGKNGLGDVWLVTNTKASQDAISYAQCVRMNIITWGYPENGSLRDLVEKYRIHPITMLSSLPHTVIQSLLQENIVLCSELFVHKEKLSRFSLPGERLKKIHEELGFMSQV